MYPANAGDCEEVEPYKAFRTQTHVEIHISHVDLGEEVAPYTATTIYFHSGRLASLVDSDEEELRRRDADNLTINMPIVNTEEQAR